MSRGVRNPNLTSFYSGCLFEVGGKLGSLWDGAWAPACELGTFQRYLARGT